MSNLIHKTRRVSIALAGVVLIAAMPDVALAQSDEPPPDSDRVVTDRASDVRPDRDHDLESVKERILAQIDRRLAALDRMSEAVEANPHITKEHAKDLQDDYKDAEKILKDAAKELEKAETFEELREIVPEVFQETLVFALQAPKTHLVVASDTVVAVTGRLSGVAERLQEVVTRLSDAGKDMTAAQAALDEMTAAITSAAAVGGPVADNVIGLDPADWPDPAQVILEQGRADIQEARGLLRSAHELLHEIVALIREAMSTD